MRCQNPTAPTSFPSLARAAIQALAALPLCALLPAQTFVVDASNGPGTHFTNLPAAVSAVPSGAVLHVRPGTYAPFTITNKSLTVVGHPQPDGTFPQVAMDSSLPRVAIGPIGSNHTVKLSGLRLVHAAPTPSSITLNIVQCAGPVVLEDVSLVSFSTPVFTRIESCANVHAFRLSMLSTLSSSIPAVLVIGSSVEFARLSVIGYRSVAAGGSGTEAMRASQASRVVIVDSSIIGGSGNFISGSPSAGAPAVIAEGNTLVHAYANPGSGATIALRGGNGGTGFPPGPAGDGLVLRSSTARVRGLTLAGGTGSPNGQPFRLEAGATISYDQNDVAPTGQLTGTLRPGNTVNYTLYARPGAPAALLIGVQTDFQAVPIVSLGMLGVSSLFSVPAANVPPTGRTEVPSLVPAGWPDNLMVLAQFVTLDPIGNEIELSNVFPATSRY